MSGFNFGGTGAPTGGFTFGTAKTATTTPATGFSFSTSGTGGFNFGTPSQPAASTPSTGLFSLTTQAPATQTPGFSFGTTTPATGGTGFSLGISTPKLNLGSVAATPATAHPGGFGLSSSTLTNAISSTVTSSQSTAPTGFMFGSATTSAAPSTTPGGFSFTAGSTSQTGTSGFNIGSMGTSTQPTALAGLLFTPATPAATGAGATQPAAPAPTAATTSAGPTLFASLATAPTSSTTTGLSLCTPSTTAGTPGAGTLGFSLKATGAASTASTTTSTTTATTTTAATTAATTTTTGFALNLKPLAPAGITSNAPAAVAAPPGPGAATGASTSPVMTYAQLESLINKWSLELEDQERHFLQQATQVNAWDRTLIENGEKITTLHREVEKVKLDQKRLDQELDFILSQQKELEDLLSPLEESVKEQSGTVYLQHADEEREKTYKLAENIDAQLKRMAQDLKDIIEHLNTSGGPADTSDPLQQICKILNAHMDSLQWIDQNSALLQRKVEEVTKVCEGRRKEQERSFRITFD
ncbi:nuclear pore glycoprotein p62 [Canis lupus baileyi]|uniref:Nuclear pore glycoprotein p62 n=2 Tax=Canis lupus familiaris TaxID=9615 RepID=A0A8C0M0Y9_CANLF|nr:nuclear pore glycoprotein p62 [Canis lupus familiaris]XP_022279333.1 nuclear pore glycoprotein p62 [Canis lupus familiaris]XP_038384089.1 nuclear pore glycoprotein p62 [Canis lupus familiaris]XP_038384091.1 nuclear pore glycoprotein p62 [Canis lupus familiaris]XP_038384092.1 nuclear pore glycoprotein p62 [Canis lupus familiaris]XP_038384093.1 nuclear pore glycoprotein p62 [Canis lupus familiaris]XP_038512176.1 nuclear pore glycoprotein p62 [Canis lupus familiaris]XP_038512177.1 nuclear po|eukprot:XP_013974236.1 nuclear pore glycoprotein p62 [Canis lupus familiaris]